MSQAPDPIVEPAPEPIPENSPPEPTPEPTPEPKTIADDPGEGLPGAATWPEDWRQRFAGKNDDNLKTLNRFKSPEGLYKSYESLRQRMSSGEFTRTKPDTEDADAMKAWREEAGVPETPEGYMEKLGELEVPPEDQPHIDKYLERMHAEGASPKHVQDGLDWYYETQRQLADERATADKQYHVQSEEELRSEWGPEFLGNINNMKAMLSTYGAEELGAEIMTARTDDGTLVGDHTEFLRMMVNIASEINPNGIVTPSVGEDRMGSIKTRKAELETEMGDTKARNSPDSYWNNNAKQEEYRKLLELEERYKGAA